MNNNTKNIQMILFDLDGTLWDSSEPVARSWNIVFEKYREEFPGLPVLTAEDIRNVMGRTMEDISRMIMPDMDPLKRSVIFNECSSFEVEYIAQHGGRLFEGLEDALKEIRDMGILMSVVSNCQTGYIEAFLSSMHMDEYFCDIESWGNTLKSKSSNIKLVMERNNITNAVYAGDTVKDGEAAAEAGIPFIWASYGFGDVSRYDYKLEEISSLPGLLKKIYIR